MSLGIGIAALLIAGLLLVVGHFFPFGLPLTLAGLGLIASFVFDRRYKPAARGPARPGWIDTGERFIDPVTKQRVAVFTDPATGERAYHEV